jgi:hypothetical protein
MVTNLHKKQPRMSDTTEEINGMMNKGISERKSEFGIDIGDQFSERLVESINMVRELLKSNKELR